MDVIVALFLTINLGTARFQSVKYKASSNAFPIYRFSLHLPTQLEDFGMRTATKLQNIFGIMQIFRKVFLKKIYVYAHIVYVCARVGEVGWEAIWLYTLRGCAYFEVNPHISLNM